MMVANLLSVLLSLQAAIFGVVQDGETQEPLPGVAVYLEGANQATTTDSSGQFRFENLPQGTYTLRFHLLGYQDQTQTLSLAEGSEKQLTISLKPQAQDLEEVSIHAIRASEETPVTQTELSKEKIERNFHGQDAQFLISEQTPAIQASSDAGTGFTNYGTNFRMRGLDVSRINITVNGVPLNDMMDQGVFFSNLTGLAGNLNQVQVQRGVGTSTNGTAAFAGSINFQTPKLQDSSSASAEAAYGSFNTQRYSGRFKTGLIKDQFAAYGSFSHTFSEGYRRHSGTEGRTFAGGVGWFGKNDMLKLTVLSGRTENGLAYIGGTDEELAKDRRFNPVHPDARDYFSQHLTSLEYTHQFEGPLSFSLTPYYIRSGGDFPYATFDSAGNFAQMRIGGLQSRSTGAFSSLNYFGEKLEAHAGLHFNYFDREDYDAAEARPSLRAFENHSWKTSATAYAKARYQVMEKLDVFADLQLRRAAFDYDHGANFSHLPEVEAVSWWFLNPKVGANYQVSDRIRAYVSAGQTTREPTRLDMLGGRFNIWDSATHKLVGDLERVDPETVTNLEAGIKYLGPEHRFKLNGYAMEFSDQIAPTGQTNKFGQSLRRNVDQSHRRGLEWQADIHLGAFEPLLQGVHLRGNGALNFSEISAISFAEDSGEATFREVTPLMTPELMTNTFLEYQFQQGGKDWFRVSVSHRYVGEREVTNKNLEGQEVAAYHVFNGRLAVYPHRNLSLSMRVQNLFDQEYRNFANIGSAGNVRYFVGAPRSYLFTAKLHF